MLYKVSHIYVSYVQLNLDNCFSFEIWQHLTSYEDRYRFVTVRTHVDFIVLHHWETRPPATGPDFPYSEPFPDTKLSGPCPVLLSLVYTFDGATPHHTAKC